MNAPHAAIAAAFSFAIVSGLAVTSGSSQVAPAQVAARVNPLRALVRAVDAAPIRGRVEQRVSAGSYTYLGLRTTTDSLLWAVTLGSGAAPGSEVTVRSMGHQSDFYSRRLQRTFPELVFGIVSRVE